jgi:hypothetical protein
MPRQMSSGSCDAGALDDITNFGAPVFEGKGAPPRAQEGNGTCFFAGMVFAFAGRFSAAQATLKGLVEGGGGSCAATVTLKVTHVISTRAAVEAEKRSAAIATAIGRGLPLLHEDFLARCVDEVRRTLPPAQCCRAFSLRAPGAVVCAFEQYRGGGGSKHQVLTQVF